MVGGSGYPALTTQHRDVAQRDGGTPTYGAGTPAGRSAAGKFGSVDDPQQNT